ncbi:MAG: hypothetical protein LUE24_05150 [Lachnospiraceae bacterium]|nr:hypothetical protein [Lachnospiraceae bacterium]
MKRWIVLITLLVSAVFLAGCGKKETGSELLTETQSTVEVTEEPVEPVVAETSEGIALHIYCGDELAENIVQTTVYVESVDEQTIMTRLLEALDISEDIALNSISFGVNQGGDSVVMLDFNQAFADYVKKLSSAGENIVMGSVTNTFLDCYQCELLLVTVEGKVLETNYNVYEEYLEYYPYIESAYRVTTELLETEDGVSISCPQIEDLGDEEIQEKWNGIMLANEQMAVEDWSGGGTYTVTYTLKTMTVDTLSILMDGVYSDGTYDEQTFKYTYNIDLNTGGSIRLADHVDVELLAEDMFEGKGYYVDEALAPYFLERIQSIYESPDSLARSLESYDYAEDGSAPYGYSYLENGKVWLCMEVPHSMGDYIEIELDAQ